MESFIGTFFGVLAAQLVFAAGSAYLQHRAQRRAIAAVVNLIRNASPPATPASEDFN